MGILGLSKLIADLAPAAIKERELKHYFGRTIAIDASMCLYQFLVAVRSEGAQLATADGQTTSHLMGIFYRTTRFVELGIKPVYVFDGKPPEMKGGELAKRAGKRDEAQKAMEAAEEAGNEEEVNKFNRRLVKVTKTHVEEAKQLLKLMGIPIIDAPCEAEAQCAAMVKTGKVFATATEDMDALTFGSKILLRRLTFGEARKVQEIHYDKVLEGLELTHQQFIDLCIMLGCDYTCSIGGIGPKRAIELIRKHKTIDAILENLDTKKFTVAENWNYQEARALFENPEVINCDEVELKWSEPDEEALVKYLCGEKQFSEDRVRSGAKKLLKAKNTAKQGRLDSYFKVISTTTSPQSQKRKQNDEKKGAAKKTKASGGKFHGKAK